jgi:cathepsin X
MINCEAGGDCNGGDPSGVYDYAYENGIPDSSCEQYEAKNLDHDCTDIDLCRDCTWPPPAPGEDLLKNCWAVPFKHYYASNYYGLSGVSKMKTEIFKNGPIACGIEVTDAFENEYKAGMIWTTNVDFAMINHEISVVGWGKSEDGTEYWIGRNSWGTYWGDYGFFLMEMNKNMLGIEEDCTAAIPSE